MNRRLARLLLRSYRAAWRAQYGQELEDLLCRRALQIGDILDVLWGGFVERMRQPIFKLSFCALAGCVITFVTSLIFAPSLWQVLATPAVDLLREQGVKPGSIVSVSPSEQIEVVWLGIPALVTAFIMFALMLMLIWRVSSDIKEIQKRQWAAQLVVSSGTIFALCAVLSFVAWRNGSIAKLLQLYPDVQNAPWLSVGHCFMLFAASTLGATLLLQIPIIIFFAWRFRAMQHLKGPAGQ